MIFIFRPKFAVKEWRKSDGVEAVERYVSVCVSRRLETGVRRWENRRRKKKNEEEEGRADRTREALDCSSCVISSKPFNRPFTPFLGAGFFLFLLFPSAFPLAISSSSSSSAASPLSVVPIMTFADSISASSFLLLVPPPPHSFSSSFLI